MEAANRALLERLEANERRHAAEVSELRRQIDQLSQRVTAPSSSSSGTRASRSSGGLRSALVDPRGTRPPEDPTRPELRDTSGGTSSRPRSPLDADFEPEFEFRDEDEEFILQFHHEGQYEYRYFTPVEEDPVTSGFYMPRLRFFLAGRMTKPIEYALSFNRGFGNLDVLDAFINFNYDSRIQLRLGRFMSPFSYEQYSIQNMWLISPERSLFTENLGLNRQVGGMVWGNNLLDGRVDYATGVFNGPRNSYEDQNDSKDVMSYLNLRPFGDDQDSPVKNLNLIGSFTYGDQNNPEFLPRSFRTATNATNAGAAERAAPPFLTFNPDVVEKGERTFWTAGLAYFYKHMTLLAEYDGGIVSYSADEQSPGIRLPTQNFYAQFGYFLTGETVERRTAVEPLRPFDLRPGHFGLGAWEFGARYSSFNIDREVFAAGLSDPDLWSNRAWATDVGFNWYISRYVKWYFDWHHSEFGSPVLYSPPARKALTNDLFWIRCQIFF
jgi:phosphate-selective porin OprO/OprP